MKTFNPEPDDRKLGALLRGSRPSPPLPPRFQEGVWRRLVDAQARDESAAAVNWLDVLVARLFRPRFALATAAVILLAGALLGAVQSSSIIRQQAQARYLQSVAPLPLR